MEKCKLCDKPIGEDSPFSNYCSSGCERIAVGRYGEEKGINKGVGFFGTILIIIFGVFFIGIKNCNSSKNQMPKEGQVIAIDSLNTTNQTKEEDNSSVETVLSEEDTVNLNEETSNNDTIINTSSASMINDTNHQDEIKKAIEMLKQDKSVGEIADSTSLTRKEIRQLRRKLRDEE